ncbi:MAG: hypothetical protein IT566_10760 [Rhodospirillaceae bacterium]|nr:hypothetical protein [Rhodospirillaceae bacterium]
MRNMRGQYRDISNDRKFNTAREDKRSLKLASFVLQDFPDIRCAERLGENNKLTRFGAGAFLSNVGAL